MRASPERSQSRPRPTAPDSPTRSPRSPRQPRREPPCCLLLETSRLPGGAPGTSIKRWPLPHSVCAATHSTRNTSMKSSTVRSPLQNECGDRSCCRFLTITPRLSSLCHAPQISPPKRALTSMTPRQCRRSLRRPCPVAHQPHDARAATLAPAPPQPQSSSRPQCSC